jgi:penicillin-binding protein 1A
VLTRLYAGDGRLMAEYAKEKRVFMPIDTIPDLLKHAFIAAEDQNFYVHQGVDFYRDRAGRCRQPGAWRPPEGCFDDHAAGRQELSADQRSVL